MKKLIERKILLLAFDLYWLRFEKPGDQWYELTDYVRDKLIEDGVSVMYKKDDLIVGNDDIGFHSMKKIVANMDVGRTNKEKESA